MSKDKPSPAVTAAFTKAPVTETGWVLESGEASAPRYLTVHAGGFAWSVPGDHSAALRLAREADGLALAKYVHADRVAEHGWAE